MGQTIAAMLSGGPNLVGLMGTPLFLWCGDPNKAARLVAIEAARLFQRRLLELRAPESRIDADDVARELERVKAQSGKGHTFSSARDEKKIPVVRFLVAPRTDGKKGVNVRTLNLDGAEVSAVGLNEKAALKTCAAKVFTGKYAETGAEGGPGTAAVVKLLSGVLKDGVRTVDCVKNGATGGGTPPPQTATAAMMLDPETGLAAQRMDKFLAEQEPEEIVVLFPAQKCDPVAAQAAQEAAFYYARRTPYNGIRKELIARLAQLGVAGAVESANAAQARRGQSPADLEAERQRRAAVEARKAEESNTVAAQREADMRERAEQFNDPEAPKRPIENDEDGDGDGGDVDLKRIAEEDRAQFDNGQEDDAPGQPVDDGEGGETDVGDAEDGDGDPETLPVAPAPNAAEIRAMRRVESEQRRGQLPSSEAAAARRAMAQSSLEA